MRRLLFFLLFVCAILTGNWFSQAGRYRDVYRSICDLTEAHFYRDSIDLRRWLAECRSKAARLPLHLSTDALLQAVQEQMSELNVSHFSVYSPDEDRKLWRGEAMNTGIRAHFIEEHLMIYQVLPGSSAAQNGVRVGDEILALPGVEHVSAWGAEHRAGKFLLRRQNTKITVTLEPSLLNIDSSPSLKALDKTTALLTISSFRAEYFKPRAWRSLAAKLNAYRHVIVDLRENSGGNFVAMLRAFSVFDCGGQVIGQLQQPRKKRGGHKAALEDRPDDLYQLRELDLHQSLGLKTFPGYGCYRGRVTVLIGSETSSVAEIFADAFIPRAQSRVWGQPSAGDVVLAVWYDLEPLGPGFSVSIPEAVFRNLRGQELEGRGVRPQKELYYDLQQARLGMDSWVSQAERY